ncbi:uncharacterized protein B0T23DRAFT_405071 [Neurospora hispaniola]|uniref:Uncharacterized protein n=1 Tax=Neurospora hispaniola TaxID=588809 RepID=A0AAJ0I513_9PEZI|nr:hypothetical protein B0T23DRAFT_405071 [Neurospora hispaniola]
MSPKKTARQVAEIAGKGKTAKRVAKFERDDALGENGDYSVRVREPAESGYHLTHTAVLASFPIPEPSNRALSRPSYGRCTQSRIQNGHTAPCRNNKRRLKKLRQRSDRNPASIKAFTARSNAKWNPVEHAKRKLVKKARLLFCEACSVAFPSDWHQRHYNSLPRHKANVAAAKAREDAEAGWEDEFDD